MSRKSSFRGAGVAWAIVGLLACVHSGCAHVIGEQYQVSDELVATEGTRFYKADFSTVYVAAHNGLSRLGFDIERESPASGRLVTDEYVPNSDMRGISVSRQYYTFTVDIDIIEPGLISVRVLPRRFTGIEKAESYNYWLSKPWMDNYWQGLFDSIAGDIGEPALREEQLGAADQQLVARSRQGDDVSGMSAP